MNINTTKRLILKHLARRKMKKKEKKEAKERGWNNVKRNEKTDKSR